MTRVPANRAFRPPTAKLAFPAVSPSGTAQHAPIPGSFAERVEVGPLASIAKSWLTAAVRFKAKLFKYPGPGGWTFAPIPARYAPPATHAWGRTPISACVDGRWWDTSVWRDKKHGTLLPVPKKVRGNKGDGDWVEIELSARKATPT